MLKHAEDITDIAKVFRAEPLESDEELDQFYCGETMGIRTNDPNSSPITDMYDACIGDNEEYLGKNAYLFLGHRGCGKSTELNRMKIRLKKEGYSVSVIKCAFEVDLLNLVHWDLLILMAQELLQIAKDNKCDLGDEIINRISDFWKDVTETHIVEDAVSTDISAGASAKTPRLLSVLNLFASLKADIRNSAETRTEIRENVKKRSSEWIRYIQIVADAITTRSKKRPILILEDLDKLDLKVAWDVFGNYATTLSQMPFTVIYTLPISMSYDPKFAMLEGYFNTKFLPMIKIHKMDNSGVYTPGIEVIKEIVQKRADLSLFNNDALSMLIEKTGGSLRDLFVCIIFAAVRANRRNKKVIECEDAAKALLELKSTLTRRIDGTDYPLLIKIYEGNRQKIEQKEMLLKLMQASVVLEYNGDRWHNLHPLIADFLHEQKLVK